MGVWTSFYLLAPVDRTLSHDDFVAMVLETRERILAAKPGKPLNALIGSGTCTEPREEVDDPEESYLGGGLLSYGMPEDTTQFPYSNPRNGSTIWYSGTDIQAIEATLRQLPYGARDTYVEFGKYGDGPAFYALAQPHKLAFNNDWSAAKTVCYTASHVCMLSFHKGMALDATEYPFGNVVLRYYDEPTRAYSYS